MIRYIYADELGRFPKLRRTMFRDRAVQFRERLGWAVSVSETGEERDAYDALNPLYVAWERADGGHGGSMRFLPTTGRTMINEHFPHLTDGVRIESPLIWECTRFCLAPDADRRISAALMLAGGELLQNFQLAHLLGVFDDRMVRIYRMLGSSPTVLGTQGLGPERISVGLWEFTEAARERLSRRSGIPAELSTLWFERSFGSALQIAA